MRYRLYDIDLVIRKTLVYTCLVAILGGISLAGIALLGSASVSVTGESNELAATVTTLAAAVAFQPLRRRIQRAIDRRFARRTVDAETAMRAFSGRLREEIDLDALSGGAARCGRAHLPAAPLEPLAPPPRPGLDD